MQGEAGSICTCCKYSDVIFKFMSSTSHQCQAPASSASPCHWSRQLTPLSLSLCFFSVAGVRKLLLGNYRVWMSLSQTVSSGKTVVLKGSEPVCPHTSFCTFFAVSTSLSLSVSGPLLQSWMDCDAWVQASKRTPTPPSVHRSKTPTPKENRFCAQCVHFYISVVDLCLFVAMLCDFVVVLVSLSLEAFLPSKARSVVHQ